jgi:hypothetical protein
MNAKDAFHQTVHAAPGGCAALAVRLNMSPTILRNKANPNNVANVVTIDDVDRVMDLTGDYAVLHSLAQAHGFICTKLDAGQANDAGLIESVTDIWSKLGTVGTQVHAALSDGRVDMHEVKHIEAAIFTAIRPMMDLLNRLNGMAEK